MAAILKTRAANEALKETLFAMANAQFGSEPFRRLLGLRMNRRRAQVYVIQRTHWTMNRRDCWAQAQAVAPLAVKKLIWEHEREELEGDASRGLPDHYTLSIREGEAIGLTAQDFITEGPSDGCFACAYAWRYLAGHSPWLKAVASTACLETSNSDEVVKGGGMAHRMALKFRDEAGIPLKEQPSNVEHMAADVGHAHLLTDVIDRHVTGDAERALVLDGARESWAIDRVWKGVLAEAIAAVAE
ncbi:MAG: iron-containing redox enzyme family protein [Stellaceae bacterium]